MRNSFIIFLVVMMSVGSLVSCASGKGVTEADTKTADGVEVISVEQVMADEAAAAAEESDSNPTNWLSAFGSIKGLNVKGYRLRGEGPDGASFDWVDLKSTKVALSDIRRGEWTLYAEAIGENGDVVATGSLKTFLSDATPLGTLFLSEAVGNGDVSCVFEWTPTQVLYPNIEIYVKTADGEFVARDKSEIKITENGEAVWTVKDMPAGTYVVRAILKDENEIVSGVAAALRVIDGKKSVGTCQFVVGKLSTVFGIDLQNIPLDTVNGSLSIEDNTLSFNSDKENLIYAWFLDGDLLASCREKTVNVSELALGRGYYRIDCIASDAAGFTSLNTMSMYIYSDGNGAYKEVTAEEADSNMGDVPVGYTEIETHKPEEVKPIVEESVADLMDKIRTVMASLDKETSDKVISEVKAESEQNGYNEKKTLKALYSALKDAAEPEDAVIVEETPVEEAPVIEPVAETVEEAEVVSAEPAENAEYKLVIESEATLVEEPETLVPAEDEVLVFTEN